MNKKQSVQSYLQSDATLVLTGSNVNLKILAIIELLIILWITTKSQNEYLAYFDMIEIVDL